MFCYLPSLTGSVSQQECQRIWEICRAHNEQRQGLYSQRAVWFSYQPSADWHWRGVYSIKNIKFYKMQWTKWLCYKICGEIWIYIYIFLFCIFRRMSYFLCISCVISWVIDRLYAWHQFRCLIHTPFWEVDRSEVLFRLSSLTYFMFTQIFIFNSSLLAFFRFLCLTSFLLLLCVRAVDNTPAWVPFLE